MVYIPPPHLSTPSRPSYAETYTNILAAHRHSPLTSASSVIILVAPDVDALCAARMLTDLFKQDDVMHKLVPVSGIAELERVRDELMPLTQLHTLILINMGAILDLPSGEWFGEFSSKMVVHVIDSTRPQNLATLFAPGENGERVVIWDDGDAESLDQERKAWEALTYDPEPDSDEESYDDDLYEDDEEKGGEEEGGDDDYEDSSPSGKRRSLGERAAEKRRKVDGGRPHRMTREERDQHAARLEKYYMAGTWYAQSASGTIYLLATALERVDNELLWLAILGVTHQYITSRISRVNYEKYHSVYYDEVFRLNPPLPANPNKTLHPDDLSVRATEELRFMLFRHWTLYDAMYHSSYVAGKLGIWKDKGRKRLTGLLAKMGFSIPQTHQPYRHMDLDLKSSLITKLQSIAPQYGLFELSYPSFVRCYGYHSQPLSAADAVEAIGALLDVAGGIKMEIEIEGNRGGGEWFGAGRVWEASAGKGREKEFELKSVPKEGDGDEGEKLEIPWWIHNFWTAYDALTDIKNLRSALNLSMSLHRAIIRQGTSIIDHQTIRTMRSHRVVVLSQGPDLTLFAHPGVLSRLALWLVDALRDRVPGTVIGGKGKKCLPFVLACLKEEAGTYIIVGVMAAMDDGRVRKNEFGLAFLDAKERCNARTRHGSFDTSVLEINQADLKVFLETLCEAG